MRPRPLWVLTSEARGGVAERGESFDHRGEFLVASGRGKAHFTARGDEFETSSDTSRMAESTVISVAWSLLTTRLAIKALSICPLQPNTTNGRLT